MIRGARCMIRGACHGAWCCRTRPGSPHPGVDFVDGRIVVVIDAAFLGDLQRLHHVGIVGILEQIDGRVVVAALPRLEGHTHGSIAAEPGLDQGGDLDRGYSVLEHHLRPRLCPPVFCCGCVSWFGDRLCVSVLSLVCRWRGGVGHGSVCVVVRGAWCCHAQKCFEHELQLEGTEAAHLLPEHPRDPRLGCICPVPEVIGGGAGPGAVWAVGELQANAVRELVELEARAEIDGDLAGVRNALQTQRQY